MGRTFDSLPEHLASWVEAQPMFFVGTAPLSGDAHVNVSPKGDDTLRVLSPTDIAYLDLTGSGAETAAHVRENGRLTLMWCSFDERPMILRAQGTAVVVVPGDADWDALVPRFPPRVGARAIVRLAVERVATSCGYAVPRMDLIAPRPRLAEWAEARGPEGLEAYRDEKNRRSIDGLPALDAPPSRPA